VLPSNHERINAPSATQKLIDVGGKTIECWVAKSPAATTRPTGAFVLFFVGKGDRADRWIDAVASAWNEPVEIWGMNYPGSGASTDGFPRLKLVVASALAVFDHLHSLDPARPIFIHAGSFGTAAALCVAARRPVAGLILQNPPPLRQLILGRYGWWNLWLIAGPIALEIPSTLDSIANAQHTTAPAIFILAGSDTLVPPPYQQKVVKAYAGEKRVITMPNATHNSPLTHDAAQQFAKEMLWLWNHPKTQPPSR
jgi:alpha-beta hydrolase superfamily lysophospholipase